MRKRTELPDFRARGDHMTKDEMFAVLSDHAQEGLCRDCGHRLHWYAVHDLGFTSPGGTACPNCEPGNDFGDPADRSDLARACEMALEKYL
ncbi:MAG: hypothetical protein WC314_20815 [Vulcanimicrobiota bacterium]